MMFITCKQRCVLYGFIAVRQILASRIHAVIKQISEHGCAEQLFEAACCFRSDVTISSTQKS